MPIYSYAGYTPVVDPTAFVHPTATLIGDAIVGPRCYVGPGASMRGDFGRVESRGDWPQFRGSIDTKFPTFDVSAGYAGAGSSALTLYGATVRDYNLTADNYDFVCSLAATRLVWKPAAVHAATISASFSVPTPANCNCTGSVR